MRFRVSASKATGPSSGGVRRSFGDHFGSWIVDSYCVDRRFLKRFGWPQTRHVEDKNKKRKQTHVIRHDIADHIYIYINMYMYIYIYIYIYIFVYVCICTSIYIYICLYIYNMYINKYVFPYVYIYIYI